MLTPTMDAQERILHLTDHGRAGLQILAEVAPAASNGPEAGLISRNPVFENIAENIITGMLAVAERVFYVLLTGLCFALSRATALLDLL